MEIDVKAEITRLSEEMQPLLSQLQQLDAKRQEIANQIVKLQGAIELLQRLDGSKG